MTDLQLSGTQEQIVSLLSAYRCITPQQLAKIFFRTPFITKSNEKYMYGQLKILEEDGIATRFKPHPSVSKYSVYYLTKKGLCAYQEYLGITEEHIGEGWLCTPEFDLGYFEYAVYSPPLRQLKHHLMLIDMYVEMQLLDVQHRNNLYAKRTAQSDPRYKLQMIRPDAEMVINEKSYTIEIDRGTENHEQLVEKFNRYFHYRGEIKEMTGSFDVNNIVFVVDGEHGGQLERRWTNILAAFYKGTRAMHLNLNLYLVTKKDFAKFLRIETDRLDYELELNHKLHTFHYSFDEYYKKNYVSCIRYVTGLNQDGENQTAECGYYVPSTRYSSKHFLALSQLAQVDYAYTHAAASDIYLANNLSYYGVYNEICQSYYDLQYFNKLEVL